MTQYQDDGIFDSFDQSGAGLRWDWGAGTGALERTDTGAGSWELDLLANQCWIVVYSYCS